jgi:hypothetical protein
MVDSPRAVRRAVQKLAMSSAGPKARGLLAVASKPKITAVQIS